MKGFCPSVKWKSLFPFRKESFWLKLDFCTPFCCLIFFLLQNGFKRNQESEPFLHLTEEESFFFFSDRPKWMSNPNSQVSKHHWKQKPALSTKRMSNLKIQKNLKPLIILLDLRGQIFHQMMSAPLLIWKLKLWLQKLQILWKKFLR